MLYTSVLLSWTVAQNRSPFCHYMLYTSSLQFYSPGQWPRTELHCVTICYTHHHFSSTLLDSGSEQNSIVSLYVIHITTSVLLSWTVAQNRTPLCHYMLYTSPLQFYSPGQWLRAELHCVTICYTHHHFSSTLLDSGSEQNSIVSLYVIHITTSVLLSWTVAQNRTPFCHYMLYTSSLQFYSPGQWPRTDLHSVTICYTHHHFSSTLLDSGPEQNSILSLYVIHFSSTLLDSGSEQISILSLYVIHIITSTVAQNRTPLCHYMLYTSSLQFYSPGQWLRTELHSVTICYTHHHFNSGSEQNSILSLYVIHIITSTVAQNRTPLCHYMLYTSLQQWLRTELHCVTICYTHHHFSSTLLDSGPEQNSILSLYVIHFSSTLLDAALAFDIK
ncbi:hypothetical protein RRG08_051160 [Elysia crispata]|uniref:Uncharacterized protein n=1 Tax=Elysia crispata TaxID=231223 RepID=A0AAE0YN21_9GAST|nr:hypothetical protein RRG08_051160 [Elysia crispata]